MKQQLGKASILQVSQCGTTSQNQISTVGSKCLEFGAQAENSWLDMVYADMWILTLMEEWTFSEEGSTLIIKLSYSNNASILRIGKLR